MSVTEQQQTPPSTAEGATAEAADQTMPSDRPSAAPVLAEGDLTFAEMFEMAEKQAKERKKAQKATPRGDKSGPGAGAESEGGLVPGDEQVGLAVGVVDLFDAHERTPVPGPAGIATEQSGRGGA